MKKILSILVLFLTVSLTTKAGIIGQWTAYPAFSDITEIEQAGDRIYVLASGGLYSYDSTDQSVVTYDKTKTLNDSQIAHIAWCQNAKRLVIVYSNENIDLLDENGNVVNISDYYSKSLTENKTVNAVNVFGNYAYLSTPFGIIKMNVKDGYICDTYNLGFNVNWTHVDSQRIYAESKSYGQYSALLTSNLLDNSNWTRTGNYTAESKTISSDLKTMAETYRPDGPKNNNFFNMVYSNNTLYTVGGLYIRGYSEANNPGTIQIMNEDSWNIYDNIDTTVGYTVKDNNCIAVDPKDKNHVYVSGRSGLYEYENGVLQNYYNCNNSPLVTAVAGNIGYTIVNGIVFDDSGNLWVLNLSQLMKLTADRQWELATDELEGYKGLGSLILDSRGILWFGHYRWEKFVLFAYDTNNSSLRKYSTFLNEDATDFASAIECLSEDKEGNIWMGCAMGPFYLPSDQVGTSDETFMQVKVPRNDGTNLADYLLSGIEITCMAIDGGNRKWFGTSGHGIYVIGSDCITQEYNFTSSNSDLISDIITGITIDNTTGEVYIATNKGLCSYRSDAAGTADALNSDNVYAYPNPVTPDYTGVITIKGLTYNASVRIVTAGGQLVAEGTSNGGLFTWDGNDLDGKRVASGVYTVFAATQDGKNGAVCKVAVVR